MGINSNLKRIIIFASIFLLLFLPKNGGYSLKINTINLTNSSYKIKEDQNNEPINDLSYMKYGLNSNRNTFSDMYKNYTFSNNYALNNQYKGGYRVNINIPQFNCEKSLVNNAMVEIMFSPIYELFNQNSINGAIEAINKYNQQCYKNENKHELIVDYDIMLYSGDIISLVLYIFSYMGQAHPLQDACFVTYNVKERCIKTIDELFDREDIYSLCVDDCCDVISGDNGEVITKDMKYIMTHYEYMESLNDYMNPPYEDMFFYRGDWRNIGMDSDYIYIRIFSLPYEFGMEKLLLRIKRYNDIIRAIDNTVYSKTH